MGRVFENKRLPERKGKLITAGRKDALPNGRGANVVLEDGSEIALFNIEGNFYAVENFCPHRGSDLAGARAYGEIIECGIHGWRFDLRNGECLTAPECPIESYEVRIEDDWIKILV